MKITKQAIAGTLESSDLLVKVSPNDKDKIDIVIKSSVDSRFGKQIYQSVVDVINQMSVTSVLVEIDDKGALDCVIKARVETGLIRASEEQKFNWKGKL